MLKGENPAKLRKMLYSGGDRKEPEQRPARKEYRIAPHPDSRNEVKIATIGISNGSTKLSSQRAFEAAHLFSLRFRYAFMVVTEQMQHSVDEQASNLRSKGCPI